MIHILVVEDDRDLNHTVCRHLTAHGYTTFSAFQAQEALDTLYAHHCDLVISDIMMPGMDGFTLAEKVRSIDSNIPLLFMTARNDFASKEKGYHLGIDDYMVKPVDLNELVLHIQALLRRAHIAAEKKLTVGNVVLDEGEMTAMVGTHPVSLTLREFQILFKLLSYPRQTFTRSQLLEDFSGAECAGGLRTVDVHITNLRAKFADCTDFEIVTVRGLGYKAVIK